MNEEESKPHCSTCVSCLIEWNAADDRRLFCLNSDAKAATGPMGYLLTGAEAESCAFYLAGKPQEDNSLTEVVPEDGQSHRSAPTPTFLQLHPSRCSQPKHTN